MRPLPRHTIHIHNVFLIIHLDTKKKYVEIKAGSDEHRMRVRDGKG